MRIRSLYRRVPENLRDRARPVTTYLNRSLPGRRVRWGSLRRLGPFGSAYGRNRGTAVDRVLIEAFLAEHADDVRGVTLEVADPRYTTRFGKDRVSEAVVLDIDPTNPRASLVADLSISGSLPRDRFDCFILTQTLQYVPDPGTGIANAVAALRPGGVLLMSVPALGRIDPQARDSDRWRFTGVGLEELLARYAAGSTWVSRTYGNVLVASAYLFAIAAEELTPEELAYRDPDYPVVVCARVQRGQPGETDRS